MYVEMIGRSGAGKSWASRILANRLKEKGVDIILHTDDETHGGIRRIGFCLWAVWFLLKRPRHFLSVSLVILERGLFSPVCLYYLSSMGKMLKADQDSRVHIFDQGVCQSIVSVASAVDKNLTSEIAESLLYPQDVSPRLAIEIWSKSENCLKRTKSRPGKKSRSIEGGSLGGLWKRYDANFNIMKGVLARRGVPLVFVDNDKGNAAEESLEDYALLMSI